MRTLRTKRRILWEVFSIRKIAVSLPQSQHFALQYCQLESKLESNMAAATHPQNQALTSWKEIAAYLGKGVRTVQRWEVDLGLPVRRPGGREKGIVCASPQDHWLATRWSQRPAPTPAAVAPQPTPASPPIQAARELWGEHRQLVGEVQRTLQDLVDRCQTLALLIAQSRNLRMRSAFPISEAQSVRPRVIQMRHSNASCSLSRKCSGLSSA
jgi:hypothetical protein